MFSIYGFSQGYFNAEYGVRAGINVSNLDIEPVSLANNDHRNGFYFGGFVEFNLSDFLSLNTEIQWSAEGSKRRDLKANYINLPIQLRFNITDRVTVGVGPQASLKTWTDNDGFETFTFSALGGLEYRFLRRYFVDVRAVYGLTDIFDGSTPLEAKQFTIQAGLGIRL